MWHLLWGATASLLTIISPVMAQTGPVNGVRKAEVRTHAITGATIFPQRIPCTCSQLSTATVWLDVRKMYG